jgi:hypothetical protein
LAFVGTITVEELHEALKNSAVKLPASEIQALMENVDMNASGAIDYEEFLAATMHASKVASDEHLRRAFQEFDHDNSGMLSYCSSAVRLLCIHWFLFELSRRTSKSRIASAGVILTGALPIPPQPCIHTCPVASNRRRLQS